jgi:AcrR family transcriptional regulator
MESSLNRSKLIASARSLFTENGYAAVSVDDIAAHAGVTKGAVYYQFRDKADLLRVACEQIVQEIIALVTNETMEIVAHSVDEIVTGSDRLFLLFERRDVRQLLVLEAPFILGHEQWATLIAPMRSELAEHALYHLADEGMLARELVPQMAEVVMGAFFQALQVAMRDGADSKTAKMARTAYRHLMQGLLTQQP